MTRETKPWLAFGSLIIGFFMILVDSTIVSVANPAILKHFGTDITQVIWVTSSYLLAYAVPLLVAGRLGDRFGAKYVYLAGLVVFTLASAWCGLSQSIGELITARAVQGLGAALVAPQTMALITRIFPPKERGRALGLWGATAGVATLVGPIAGGLLVDGPGWEWIFFVNVPVGIAGFVMAAINVPALSTHPHRFDILGVVLSGTGLALLVFGIQEGNTYNWDVITSTFPVIGTVTVWGLIIAGIAVLGLFLVWQRLNRGEPLLPLALFGDRNFSIANAAITLMGAIITSLTLPIVFFAQLVMGLTPTQSALVFVPMAVLTGALAPVAGRLVNKMHPSLMLAPAFVLLAISMLVYMALFTPGADFWPMWLPAALLGISMAFIWGPLGAAALRNLPMNQAGAGSGVYNTTRQIGAVLGSATISAIITWRIGENLPGHSGGSFSEGGVSSTGKLPAIALQGFSDSMAQSLWFVVASALVAALVVLLLQRPKAVSDAAVTAGAGAH